MSYAFQSSFAKGAFGAVFCVILGLTPFWGLTAQASTVSENLRITEIMYHPFNPGDPNNDPNTEYLELQNIGPDTIQLDRVRFLDGIDFTFPAISLDPNAFVLVVEDTAAFQAAYEYDLPIAGQYQGLPIAGEYVGSLNNNGENLLLVDANGLIIHNFEYSDNWFDMTDGEGFSLTIRPETSRDPNLYQRKAGWRPSSYIYGSPGAEDSGDVPGPGSIVINEVMTHSHAENSDWIELYNTTDQPIDISGWYLSDDGDEPKRFEIPQDTIIDANDYVVFYETDHFDNPFHPGALVPFALNENGETVYLRSAVDGELTGFATEEDFGPATTGVSFGLYQKANEAFNFVPLVEPTPGAVNAYPVVGPIVISEIMYHPADDNEDAEYVELANVTDHVVVLYNDTEKVAWRFVDDPDNPGVDLTLPANPQIQMEADERILLVRDLFTFSSTYTVPDGVQIFQWIGGHLSNAGEKLQLNRPGELDESLERQWIRVDRVNYSDGSHHSDFDAGVDPWPALADGSGNSLHKTDPNLYGNDAANWIAASPSPGL